MRKLNKAQLDKLKQQMGVTSRKTADERGRFPRPAVFADKKKQAIKYAARRHKEELR